MKKAVFITIILSGLTFFANAQCTSCANSTIDPTANSSAVGQNNTSIGQASFSMGDNSVSKGIASGAFGKDSEAWADVSFSFGYKVKTIASASIIMGSGYHFSDYLVNIKDQTLMIGFNSTAPTFFISKSNTDAQHKDRTGRIGIGNVTSPLTKLHIKADDNEKAELFLEAHTWNSSAVSSIFIGDQNHSVSASGELGLVFSTGFNKSFIFNYGRVGIGVENPEEQLQVKGTILTDGFKMPQTEIRDGWVLTADQTGRAFWAPTSNLWLLTETNDVYRPVGNVGIGTSKPLSRLEVVGQVSIGYNVAAVDENNLIVEDNVGIGTSTPSEKLDVVGKIKTTKFQLLDGQINGNILMSDNEGNASWVDPSLIDDGDWSILANNLYVDGGRHVGIGTSTPTQALDLVGNIKISGNIYGSHNNWQSLKLYGGTNENDGAYMMLGSNYDQTASIKFFARGESGQIEFHTQSHKVMALKDNGNVIMGTTDNSSHLVVYGEVTANKFRATANIGWYDHVFKKDYKLMPLNELENFVNKNHHLPDMPTQKQVHEDGLDIAEMNALLLKKVEELTLYVIELKKENEGIKNLLNTK